MTIEEANAELAGLRGAEPANQDTETITIEEANAKLRGAEPANQDRAENMSIEEANAALGVKPELGTFERMALEQKAKTGNEASVLDFLPVIGGMRNAEQNRQEAMEQKLFAGEYRDTLEASRYALSLGIAPEEVRRINGLGDDAAVRKGFSDAVKDRFAARIKTREEAQRKLQSAEAAGTVEKIVSGTITGGATVLEFANPITMAAGTAGKIINGIGDKGRDIYTLDENGNPVIAKDEKGKELRGDRSERAAAGVIASKYAEQIIWTNLGLKHLVGRGVKILDKIPVLSGAVAKGVGKVAGAAESAIGKIASTEGGRLALETGKVIGKVNDTLHFGSLPDMMFKSHLTELTDVLLSSAPEERKGNFKKWLDKFTSIKGNAEMLTGIIGIHFLTAGFGALRARGRIYAYRHLDAKGRRGGREEFVAEYIGKDAAKRLSNTDLGNIYELLTSPELSEDKINEFLQKIDADAKAAKEKIDGGESVASVIEGIREKMKAGSEGVRTAAERIRETLENKRTLTPEMEDALDGKISEYTRELGTAAEPMAKMVKDDILSNVKDNAVYEQPEMLDELVAMSLRKFNSEGRRLRIHDVRGEKNTGAQLRTISELGITSWEQAETEGLVTKDKYGRYGGGARRALNIALHGSEKLQAAVRDGKISGETAERLLTASQCELGARPVEEQTALVDGILERAKGDEALARRMLDKLEAGTEALQHEKLGETLDRLVEESKADAIAERNGVAKETAQGVAVEPVETADGQLKTVGEIVDAGAASGQTTEPKPTTALGGAEQADRLAGTKLTVFNGTTMSCETFPEAKVEVSADGITVRGLTADTMAKPDQVADVAAFVTHLMRIAKRNGKTVQFEDADAATIAQALVKEIAEKGAEKTMAKLETRGRLFGLLFKTTLGNGVTYDEASFKKALEKVGNGRQFVNNHGDVYGFVDAEGVIHFNPATFNMDTPIHEYGHVALEATKKINNALWRKGNELIKESRYYRDLLAEIERDKNSPYRSFNEEGLCDEALARLIGDEGAKLVESKGLDAQLKSWLKEVWKSFKGALGIADLTEEQIEKMTIREFADTLNAELLKGSEFGAKKKTPPSQKSIRRYDEQTDSGSTGVLRWKNDRGYLFAIPVDMERTQPGGKVVFATDDANITDWIQNALNGYTLRLSKSGRLYVEGRDGLPPELAEIFGRYPEIGQNDGIYEELSPEARGVRYDSPEALVDALRKDRENYDAWVQGRAEKDAEAQHYADQQEREAFQRWEDSGMSVMDYIRSRVEEGDPEFDLDWETARELEREAAEVPFSVRRGGSAAERERAKFAVGDRAKDGAARNNKVRLEPDLSKRENSLAFKRFVKGIPAAPMPERLKDSSPKNVFAWFEENMVGKTYSFDIPGYGHREFTPTPGHIGKLVCSGGRLADGTKIVKGRIKKSTGGKDWRQMVRDGEILSSDVEGWDRARAKSLPLIPKVLNGFDFVLHEKDPSGHDILIFCKKFKNKNGRPNTIVMKVIDDGKTIGPISTHVRDLTDTWLKNKDLVTTSGNEVYDRGEVNSASRSPTPTDNAERNSVGTSNNISNSSQNGKGVAKMSVGRLYTGSAADYEKPSLLKVGTGEGSQVYGWGLYASSERGVAENYMRLSKDGVRNHRSLDGKPWYRPKDLKGQRLYNIIDGAISKAKDNLGEFPEYHTDEFHFEVLDAIKDSRTKLTEKDRSQGWENDYANAERWFEENWDKIGLYKGEHLYEQTFFTNRAPGDESHLLNWYEPVGKTNANRVLKAIDSLGIDKRDLDATFGKGWRERIESLNGEKAYQTVEAVYKNLVGDFDGNESQAASELLAKFDIDGVKYPVDSYGKTVKDGDEAGWNYVSFRDDNINVDHKWVDGQAKFSVGAEPDLAFDPSMIVYNPKLKAMGETEQNRGGIAAGIEKKEALRPWTRKGSPCDLAKPIAMDCADMVQLFRAVSGSTRNPIIRKGEHIPGRPNAIGLNRGGSQIELANRLFGMVDASDVGKLKADCTTDGYFRNENPDWCAAQTKDTVQKEAQRSRDELDRRTRELIRQRVATGEGGMHYATQVLGHEIGHTIAMLPRDKNLGSVGNAMRTLFDSMQREMKRALDPLRRNKGEPNLTEEVDKLITGWHGAETLPNYFKKPQEKFAELFGIFLTQPEYVHTEAPKAYDALVKMMGQNEKLALAYRRINEAKWNGTSNKRVMAELEKTWKKEQQDQFRKLNQLAREPISKARDWFNYALNDRFGPMFAMSQRSLKAEKKLLKQAVKEGAMSAEEAAERIRTREAEINALKTSLFDWQRQTGGATRLMMADLDDVIRTAERDGVNWDNVRKYAHLNRVIELGGRATAHGIDPSRAAAMLGDMARELGAENWTKVEKTWKAYRAVYERHVLEDGKVREMFGEDVMKFLDSNKHYVTMKHRMSAEESAEWMARIEEYRAKNKNAWDPTIDLWERMNRGLKGQSGVNAGFKLHTLEGSFEATEDPIAATMMTALTLKENAARNHLLKTMSQTLRDCGVKGVYDTALEKGAKEHAVDPGVYERLTYMDGGVKHELIVPLVIGKSFTTKRALPRAVDFFGGTMRFLRNTMTLWNPAFINRAYLIDKSSLETNIEGLHKPAIDVLSEALCFRGIGVPLYMVNNYLARFTPIANTWLGKILWNEHTVNHYAHRAQKIARMIYEGKFSDRLEEARRLREQGHTGEATEIEQNVTIAREMMKKNVFQSLYEFNVEQSGLETAEILNKFGYRLEGGERPKSWYGKAWTKVKNAAKIYNRFEEEQEAVTKIVAYLYRMKVDEAAGRTSAADVDARARLVIEQGGTPNLSARGVLAGAIENATGFFWNVRKEGFLRTVDALKDHPTEWIAKNFAQTAMPALLKGMIVTGCMELLIKKFFDDDDEKIKESWWAPAVLDHCRFVNSAMKCVPGYYQRNYNVIPLAKFGDEVLSLRVKYSPEEFAIQNAIHTAMQKFGADPTDPSADWSTLSENMMTEFLPNIFGHNYALDSLWALVGPLVGINPYDQFRQRHIYDENLFKARALRKGDMAKEMAKSFWNYSPLGSFGGKLTDGLERRDVNDELPEWLDGVLSTPFVKMIPASMLTITSKDSYIKGLKDVDQEQRAAALVHAHDILVESIKRGSLGGFTEGLKDVPNEYRGLAVRHVLNGWRQWHMDPATKQLKSIRGIKDPELKRRAWQMLQDGEKYQD